MRVLDHASDQLEINKIVTLTRTDENFFPEKKE